MGGSPKWSLQDSFALTPAGGPDRRGGLPEAIFQHFSKMGTKSGFQKRDPKMGSNSCHHYEQLPPRTKMKNHRFPFHLGQVNGPTHSPSTGGLGAGGGWALGPRNLRNYSRSPSRSPPRGPRAPQDSPGRPPRGPQDAPRGPKTPPRRPQDAPGRPQEAPGRPQDAPGTPKILYSAVIRVFNLI